MLRKIAPACTMFALVTGCAQGSVNDATGSQPMLTTATISGGQTSVTSVTSAGTGDSEDSDDSAGSVSDSNDSNNPTSGPPGTSGPSTTSGPTSDATTEPPQPMCGNSIREGTEECDTADLGGESCQSLGLGEGNLACDFDCNYFVDGCYKCGDGKTDMAEACDGNDFGGKTCQTQGFGGGNLACSFDCKQISTSGCTPLVTCNNGVKEGSEQCDGANLGGQTCVSLGFDQGTLLCTGSCTFDTSNCEALTCAGFMEFCIFNENDLMSNCCPAGVKGNMLGICDILFCF